MRPARILVVIVASIFGLVAVGLLVGGSALFVIYGTQRDADGFLTSPDYELATDDYALVSTDLDLEIPADEWWPDDLVNLRLDAAPAGDEPLFVGIGPSADVAAYLDGVAYAEVTRLGAGATDVAYELHPGDAAPQERPGDLDFWVVAAEGPEARSLTWEVDAGSWTVVVMNADVTPGVDTALEVGAKVDVLPAVAAGLLIAALVLGAIASAMLAATLRAPEAAASPTSPQPEEAGDAYPVVVEGSLDPGLSRWKWLVKWFLAIPHFVVLAFLWSAFVFLSVVAFFAILFTGRYPKGIFDFNVGVMRWSWRVGFYAFDPAATDSYPPFTLADVAEYPARLDVYYPDRLSRRLVLVKWWLLAIPHYVIVAFLVSGVIWWTTNADGNVVFQLGGGLMGILVLVALLALAFTGRYPRGLFDLLMGFNRWIMRVVAYAALMRDEYPPFRLDMGGADPGAPRRPPAAGSGGDTRVLRADGQRRPASL